MTEQSSDALERAAYEAAKDFLELIAIVDDGNLGSFPKPKNTETPKPGRKKTESGNSANGSDSQPEVKKKGDSGVGFIDYESISRAALKEGVFCSLINPQTIDEASAEDVAKKLLKADIIVLDWRMGELLDGEYATLIIKSLIEETNNQKRQLVCIYSDLPEALNSIETLKATLSADVDSDHPNVLVAGALTIVWYAKTKNSQVDVVEADNLPVKLIQKFASCHKGLVPIIALRALRAVRKNTHPILERYGSKADLGFLTDCVLLGGQNNVSPGVRAALSDDLANAIEGDNTSTDTIEKECLKFFVEESIKRPSHLPDGIKASPSEGDSESKQRVLSFANGERDRDAVKSLSKGTKKQALVSSYYPDGDKVDCAQKFLSTLYPFYAFLLCSRFYPQAAPMSLSLGTVIKNETNGDAYVCVRPECDCVRLDSATAFSFIALEKWKDDIKGRLALPIGVSDPLSLYVRPLLENIKVMTFAPDPSTQTVRTENGTFIDIDSVNYSCIGSLRVSHSHRLLNAMMGNSGRVGVTEGEFARLMVKG